MAYAVRPSRLICAAPRGPYGLTTEATSGIVATLREHRAHPLLDRRIAHRAVADPPDDRVGVARLGRAGRSSSCWAVPEPVPGSENELL